MKKYRIKRNALGFVFLTRIVLLIWIFAGGKSGMEYAHGRIGIL